MTNEDDLTRRTYTVKTLSPQKKGDRTIDDMVILEVSNDQIEENTDQRGVNTNFKKFQFDTK